jgi:hypothetical protein
LLDNTVTLYSNEFSHGQGLLATVLNLVGVPTAAFSDGLPGEFDELKA